MYRNTVKLSVRFCILQHHQFFTKYQFRCLLLRSAIYIYRFLRSVRSAITPFPNFFYIIPSSGNLYNEQVVTERRLVDGYDSEATDVSLDSGAEDEEFMEASKSSSSQSQQRPATSSNAPPPM